MRRPKLKIGQKHTTPDGIKGTIVASRMGTQVTYLGYQNEKEYWDRLDVCYHTISYERGGNKMDTVIIKEQLS